MIYTGRKEVVTPGVAVPLASVRTMASWVTVIALRDNTGIVYVGGIDETTRTCAVVRGSTTHVGHPLVKPNAASDSSDFCNLREVGGPPYIDLSQVYIDADTANDGVTFNYGRR